MICVCIAETSVLDCLKALRGIEFAEVRLEKVKGITPEKVKTIMSSSARIVATCRPEGGMSDKKREQILAAAIDNGATFIDLEIESEEGYRKGLADAARRKGCGIIISYHNYELTPPSEELKKIIGDCFKAGADIAKIACQANSQQDNARLMDLIGPSRNVIAIGMGEKGAITRITGPFLGSPFTYASLDTGKETAPGQMDYRTIQTAIDKLMQKMAAKNKMVGGPGEQNAGNRINIECGKDKGGGKMPKKGAEKAR